MAFVTSIQAAAGVHLGRRLGQRPASPLGFLFCASRRSIQALRSILKQKFFHLTVRLETHPIEVGSGNNVKGESLRIISAPAVVVAALLACGAGSAQETAQYSYDALGRLTGAAYTGGPRAGKQSGLAYDPAGNRTAQSYGVPLPSPNNAAAFSISGPGSVQEGQTATFTITKSAPARDSLSVNYATVSGTAASPGDFAATSGTVTFLGWETVKTVAVQVIDDGLAEGAEQFSLTISTPTTPATIAVSSASVTIAASSAANQPPVAQLDVVSGQTCTSVSFTPTANDTDPESNYPLYITSIDATTLGDFSFNSSTPSPTVTFTGYGVAGSKSLTYQVRDSLGAVGTGQINLTVVNNGGCN